MRRKLTAVLVTNLFAGSAGVYGQGLKWTGEASVGLRKLEITAHDKSKFREYRDIDDWDPITTLDLRADSDRHRFNFFIENAGKDDQYIDIRGTEFGRWKFRLYDNEVRHRFGFGPGALSPYSGIGTPTLSATFPNLAVATWNPFDDSLKRRDVGAMGEWSALSPWYFRVDGNEVTRKGIKVIGASLTTSPGGGSIDLPSPVDWTTRNLSGEFGYQGTDRHFAVSFLHSKYENDNEFLRWTNPGFANGLDTSVLPQNNTVWRLGLNGNIRRLPWNSTLAGRVTYSKLTNDVPVLPTILSTGGTNPSTASSSPVFEGEVITTTAAFTLSSQPMRALDTRVYYTYRERENNSTQLIFNPTAASGLQCGGGPCETLPFDYEKHNLGFEAYYRLNPENRIGGGYDHFRTTRNRPDFPKTIDNRYFAELRNSSFDTVDGRLRYTYLQRRSVAFPYADPANPIDAFVRRFDYANVNQHQVKLNLDANPIPGIDVGFDAIYKYNDYKDTPLGRTKDKRQEYYASVGFGDPARLRVLFFADLELVDYDSRHRVGAGTPNPNAGPEPAAPAVSTTYTWTADNKDRSWQAGVALDWRLMPRVMFKSSLVWAETQGTVDFAAQPGTILTAPLLPIGNFDNTRRLALNLRAIYDHDRNWRFTGGYAFESYHYDDIGYTGFKYIVPGGVAPTFVSTSYYTGQQAFQPHNAHIVYLYATYKFQ